MQTASEWLGENLFTVGPVSDTMAWLVIGLFTLAGLVEWYGRRTDVDLMDRARWIGVTAWVGFGLFWLNLFPAIRLRTPELRRGTVEPRRLSGLSVRRQTAPRRS